MTDMDHRGPAVVAEPVKLSSLVSGQVVRVPVHYEAVLPHRLEDDRGVLPAVTVRLEPDALAGRAEVIVAGVPVSVDGRCANEAH